MKKSAILIELFLSYSITLFAQENSKNYILALSVDLYIETPARVTCDNFATAFNSRLTVNAVTQNDSVAMFSSYLQKARYAKHDRGIDVRCKFVYVLDDINTATVCTNGLDILINGRMIKKDKQFIRFLNSIVHRYP
jgi:hypothetical protein